MSDDRCTPPDGAEDGPRWIGDTLWASPDRLILDVVGKAKCGRAGDDYECDPTCSVRLNAKPDARAFLLAAAQHFPNAIPSAAELARLREIEEAAREVINAPPIPGTEGMRWVPRVLFDRLTAALAKEPAR